MKCLINVDRNVGSTPLIIAAKLNNTDIISLLIKNGADVNAQNMAGK